MSLRLKSKLNKIERALAAAEIARINASCNCRRETKWHTIEELQKIMAVSCPVHGFMHLGSVWWTPPCVPINEEDWEFCSCPPDVWRDEIMGRLLFPEDPQERKLLKEKMLREQQARWSREATEILENPNAAREFAEWSAKVDDLFRKYDEKKVSYRRSNGD